MKSAGPMATSASQLFAESGNGNPLQCGGRRLKDGFLPTVGQQPLFDRMQVFKGCDHAGKRRGGHFEQSLVRSAVR